LIVLSSTVVGVVVLACLYWAQAICIPVALAVFLAFVLAPPVTALQRRGLAHTRYLCKRLRARFPAIKILVGRWGLKGNLEGNRHQLQEAGADGAATTLLETRSQMRSLLPLLAREQATLVLQR
jgi:hypothetical protein